MSPKFKIYTDFGLLSEGRAVQMLIPFLGSSIRETEARLIENGRFDEFIDNGKEYLELSSIEECDACLLPIYYDLSEKRPLFEKIITPFIENANSHQKKVLIFAGHDIANINITIENSIVFNSALSKSQQANNEESWPHFFEDFLKKHNAGVLKLRLKNKVPIIGFCGYAPPLNIKIGKEKVISSLKLAANYMGIIQRYPERASHSYRARAIIGLQKSKKVVLNFRLKSNFAFGPSGLNTGNTNESNDDFRKNFVENILESDYTLCVRGIGNNSIRFFETLCCGRIPIFVNTDSSLPYDSIIDWKKLCVWVEEKDIDRISDIVAEFHQAISEEDFISLQKKLRIVWEEYLSPVGFYKNLALLVKDESIINKE